MDALFQWDNSFLTSLSSVDDQHQRLVDLINELGQKVVSPEPMGAGEYHRIIKAIAGYATYHFRHEEQLIESEGLDPRYLEKQRTAHREFVQQLSTFGEPSSLELEERAPRLLVFLITWLTFHILEIDQSIPRQMEHIQKGIDPQGAFQREEEKVQVGSKSLVSAMDTLLQIVCERNRDLTNLNTALESKVREKTEDLRRANQVLEDLAVHDDLTGLPNRRFAMINLKQRLFEFHRYRREFGVLLIDADRFKRVNDTFGHLAGDLVIRKLAEQLLAATRKSDIVCRLGGDEFLVICPNSSFSESETVAQKIIEGTGPIGDGLQAVYWDGSVSIGIAEATLETQEPETVLERADRSLYLSKQKGGGRYT